MTISTTSWVNSFSDDSTSAGAIPSPVSVATVLTAGIPFAVAVSDNAAAVQANLDALESLAAAGRIKSISLTDPGAPTLSVTVQQFAADGIVLGEVVSSHTVAVINSGTVLAPGNSIYVPQGTSLASITNSGTIENQSATNADIAIDGTVTNGITNLATGVITGDLNNAIYVGPSAIVSAITNSGTIQSLGTAHSALSLYGAVTNGIANNAGGLIAGGQSHAIYVDTSATVTAISNAGTINNQSAVDADIAILGKVTSGVTNLANGMIIGGLNNAIYVAASGTVSSITNNGIMDGQGADHSTLSLYGTVTNGITNDAGGSIISEQSNAIYVDPLATVSAISNGGTIENHGATAAIAIHGTVTNGITNLATGAISSGLNNAIYVTASGTVSSITNSGTIRSSGFNHSTLSLYGAVTNGITNNAGGLIIGAQWHAIYVDTLGTVSGISNSGTIQSEGGVFATIYVLGAVTNGITNNAGGVIENHSGGQAAIMVGNTTTRMDIVNAGTISTVSGTAIDLSLAGAASTITNTGTITGTIELSGHGDVVNINGGHINGDILASVANQGTVNIAVGAGNIYSAGGRLGDPAGMGLAAVNLVSGELSVAATGLNATTVNFVGSATELALTGPLSAFHETISGFAVGDSIDLAGTAATAVALNSNNQLVVSNGSATVATLQLSGDYSGTTFGVFSDAAGGSLIELAMSASSAMVAFQAGHLPAKVLIADSAANVSGNLNALQSLAAAGKLAAITLTDGGTPSLTVTPGQLTQDAAALNAISGSHTLNAPGVSTGAASFIVQQDALGRGANGIALDYAGTAPAGGNSVVGFQNATFTSGVDAVLLDNPRSHYAIQVAADGTTTIQDIGAGDATYGQTVTVKGESYIVFNGANLAASTVTASGAPTYPNDMLFIQSPANAQLAQFYAAILERIPDLAGLEYWQNSLAAGTSLADIAQAFISTSMFANLIGADPSTLTHSQYVSDLYHSILGRAADPGGLAYWVAAMDAGMSQAAVLVNFTSATAAISAVNAMGGNSGWLINPSVLGGYADTGLQMNAQAVLNVATASHFYNLSLIDPSTVTSAGLTAGGVTVTPGAISLSASAATSTVYLSSGFTQVTAANSGNTIHDGAGADTITVSGANTFITVGSATTDTLNLAGGTNSVVSNYTVGKGSLLEVSGNALPSAVALLNGTATAVQGSSLSFGSWAFFVNIGSVGGGSAAEVVTAANKAYLVADATGEHVMFLGTDNAGDTAIWSFRSGADNHQVVASELTLVATLIGIPASSLTVAELA